MHVSFIAADITPDHDVLERPHLAIDLNEELVRHPAATFFLRVKGDATPHADVRDDDVLIVDRAVPPKRGSLVVAIQDGDLRVCRIGGREEDLEVWGTVTYVIHRA